jgi:hypothetical protein
MLSRNVWKRERYSKGKVRQQKDGGGSQLNGVVLMTLN